MGLLSARIETSIDIAAPPATVWRLLTNFPRMGDWNPFITAIEGRQAVGERLLVRTSLGPGEAFEFRPILLRIEPERELRWRGQLPVPGLFSGEHYFLLSPLGTGARLDHGENFEGLLVLLMPGLLRKTERSFEAMNAALKRVAEADG